MTNNSVFIFIVLIILIVIFVLQMIFLTRNYNFFNRENNIQQNKRLFEKYLNLSSAVPTTHPVQLDRDYDERVGGARTHSPSFDRDDTLAGGAGTSPAPGGNYNDQLVGGGRELENNDQLVGGAGNDRLMP